MRIPGNRALASFSSPESCRSRMFEPPFVTGSVDIV